MAKKKTTKKKATQKKIRRKGIFPAVSFEEALTIPLAIQKHAAGQKVRRLTLFDHIGKSPDSGPSMQMVANASKYGLIKGSSRSEFLELTPQGLVATSNDTSQREKLNARFSLAISRIEHFKQLYDVQKGQRLPANSILEDLAEENGVPKDQAKECVEKFIVNAKYIGLLKTLSGADRIVPIEQLLEELPRETKNHQVNQGGANGSGDEQIEINSKNVDDWSKICFYISPIGEEESEHRKHSDLFLGSIVEPALEEFALKVIRADQIGKPGMITAQIIEYILKSKLVIADLSYHNPNVFYELSLRHACRLPTVQVIRKCDKIPFDMDQFRTIQIDTTDIFSLVPNMQTYKAEIANQARTALKDPDSVDNPLSTYYPQLKVNFS